MLQQLKTDLHLEYGPSMRIRRFAAAVFNPSMRACALIRIATTDSKVAYWFARNVLVSFHSTDIGRGVKIGAPLTLPHPLSIVLGKGVTIGAGVIIYQGVTVGTKNKGYPVIEDNVTIYPGAVIVGAITVGSGAVIGAGKFVDRDVPANSVVR